MDTSRRSFIAVAATAPLALWAVRAPAQDAAPACYDPAKLPLSQKSMRRSLGYLEVSPDPKKHCGLCAFFTGTQAGCGTCALLSGNPVNTRGVCNSFAPKA